MMRRLRGCATAVVVAVCLPIPFAVWALALAVAGTLAVMVLAGVAIDAVARRCDLGPPPWE